MPFHVGNRIKTASLAKGRKWFKKKKKEGKETITLPDSIDIYDIG